MLVSATHLLSDSRITGSISVTKRKPCMTHTPGCIASILGGRSLHCSYHDSMIDRGLDAPLVPLFLKLKIIGISERLMSRAVAGFPGPNYPIQACRIVPSASIPQHHPDS